MQQTFPIFYLNWNEQGGGYDRGGKVEDVDELFKSFSRTDVVKLIHSLRNVIKKNKTIKNEKNIFIRRAYFGETNSTSEEISKDELIAKLLEVTNGNKIQFNINPVFDKFSRHFKVSLSVLDESGKEIFYSGFPDGTRSGYWFDHRPGSEDYIMYAIVSALIKTQPAAYEKEKLRWEKEQLEFLEK